MKKKEKTKTYEVKFINQFFAPKGNNQKSIYHLNDWLDSFYINIEVLFQLQWNNGKCLQPTNNGICFNTIESETKFINMQDQYNCHLSI